MSDQPRRKGKPARANGRSQGNNRPKKSQQQKQNPPISAFQTGVVSSSAVSSVNDIVARGSIAFVPRQYSKPLKSGFLSVGAPQHYFLPESVDPWDAANQQQMLQLEQRANVSSGGLPQLVEAFQQMRETERKEMESRGLVDKQDSRKALSEAIVFVGTCQTMCPTFERIRRTYENNVKALEREADGSVTVQKAVKAFARSSAGQPPPLPSDVRPPRVLTETLEYLVREIVPRLPDSHSFLWDRTRSIRQDFTFQHFTGPASILCHEVIARVHIICLHVMAGSSIDFSRQQELEQLNKTLQTLEHLYEANRDRPQDTQNEAEFRAYQLLSHLKDTTMDYMAAGLPHEVVKHPLMALARDLRRLAAGLGPRAQVGELFARLRDPDTPLLFQCLLEVHFNDLRLAAVRSINRALHQKSKKYPLDRLYNMLGFSSMDICQQFMEYCGLSTQGFDVLFDNWNESVVDSKQPHKQPCEQYISERLDYSVIGMHTMAQPAPPIKPQVSRVSFSDRQILDFLGALVRPNVGQIVTQEANRRRQSLKEQNEAAKRLAAQRAFEERKHQEAEMKRQEDMRRVAEAKAAKEQAEREQKAAEERAARQASRYQFVERESQNVWHSLLYTVHSRVWRVVQMTSRAARLDRKQVFTQYFAALRQKALVLQAARDRQREVDTAMYLLDSRAPRRVRSGAQRNDNCSPVETIRQLRSAFDASQSQSPTLASPPVSEHSDLTTSLKRQRSLDVLEIPSLRRAKKQVLQENNAQQRVPAVPKALLGLREQVSRALDLVKH